MVQISDNGGIRRINFFKQVAPPAVSVCVSQQAPQPVSQYSQYVYEERMKYLMFRMGLIREDAQLKVMAEFST